MLFHDSRRDTRTGPDGELVLLEDQDRRCWDRDEIEEGIGARDARCAGGGPYPVQAAIAADHARAPTPEATDWGAIAALYERCSRGRPEPGRRAEPGRGGGDGGGRGARARADRTSSTSELAGYHLFHAARADLLRRLGPRRRRRAGVRPGARASGPARRARVPRAPARRAVGLDGRGLARRVRALAGAERRRPTSGSGLTCGSHSSHFGRYQFQSPRSFMLAGSRTPRMIVASSRTATARPTPICLKSSSVSVAKIANTATITTAALVTTPAVFLTPRKPPPPCVMPRSIRLADSREDEHVVVHRQPEQDHEQEQRQPRRDRVAGGEVEQALRPLVLEDQHEHSVRRADREQVQQDRLDRDHDRAERDQQQQERGDQDEPEHVRQVRLHVVVEVDRLRRAAGHIGAGRRPRRRTPPGRGCRAAPPWRGSTSPRCRHPRSGRRPS